MYIYCISAFIRENKKSGNSLIFQRIYTDFYLFSHFYCRISKILTINMKNYQPCDHCVQPASVKCICDSSEFYGCPIHFGLHFSNHTHSQFQTQQLLINITQQEALIIEKTLLVSPHFFQIQIQRLIEVRNRAVELLLAQIREEDAKCLILIQNLHTEHREQVAFVEDFRTIRKLSATTTNKFGLILRDLKIMERLSTENIEKALRRGGIDEDTFQDHNVADFTRSPRELWNTQEHKDAVQSVCVSPCSEFVCSGSFDTKLRVWETLTGVLTQEISGHVDRVTSVDFSPDGKLIASGSKDKTIKVWEGPVCIRTLQGHSNTVKSVCFSSCGKFLASGSSDNSVKVWCMETWSVISTLTQHTDWVNCVKFSPCGQWLASGSDDKTIEV